MRWPIWGKKGFAGLLLFFFMFPLAASFLRASQAQSAREQLAAESFVKLQRGRFFEANVRQSFLRVLSSARGATGPEIVADASSKLVQWSAAVYEASRQRGAVPLLWAGCRDSARFPGQRTRFNGSNEFFESMLSYKADRGILLVKFRGNDPQLAGFDCTKKDMGLLLAFENDSYEYEFPQGLYAGANSSVSFYGFEQDA